jgi:hypothetical protein
VAGAVLLVVAALALVALRARRFGRLEAGALMVLGIASMGGSEWVREGLRKPWVIDRYMFVNGVRVGGPDRAAAEDPFALDALARRGVLATSPWAVVPAAYRPGDPSFEGLAAAERAALEARPAARSSSSVRGLPPAGPPVRLQGKSKPRSRRSSTRRPGR